MNKDLLNILANSNKDIDNQQLMDYLSGNLSGEPLHDVERTMADNAFLNDAVEGLQQMGNRKKLQAYVDDLNTALQKSMAKKKQRRLKRQLKDNPWTFLAIGLVIALCIMAYWIVHILLLKK
jgi:phage terminase small subunit